MLKNLKHGLYFVFIKKAGENLNQNGSAVKDLGPNGCSVGLSGPAKNVFSIFKELDKE